MTLGLFRDAAMTLPLDTSFANGLNVVHPTRSTLERVESFYIGSTSTAFWYANVTLEPGTVNGQNHYNSNGHELKLWADSIEPDSRHWAAIPAGNTVRLSQIGSPALADTSPRKVWLYSKTPTPPLPTTYAVDVELSYEMLPR